MQVPLAGEERQRSLGLWCWASGKTHRALLVVKLSMHASAGSRASGQAGSKQVQETGHAWHRTCMVRVAVSAPGCGAAG